jgi:hypothetical protein
MLTILAQTPQRWDTTTWILLCIAAGATMYVMYRSRRRWKDPLSPKKVVPSTSLSPAQQRAVERQMQELLVELSDMSRQITGQLDTRAARLEVLIRQADERIAKLSHADSTTPSPTTITPVLVPEVSSSTSESSQVPDPAPETDSTPMVAIDEIVQPPAAHREVYVLADEGSSPQQIADRLSRPRGEIELILALRPSRSVEQSTTA